MPRHSARPMMFDEEKVRAAFAWRDMPLTVLRPAPALPSNSSDEEDALFFQGRDWRSLTWEQWNDYFRGIFFFTPEAVAYYMPSIMLLSLKEREEGMLAVSSLLIRLQRGVNCGASISHATGDLLYLTKQECKVLVGWLMHLCTLHDYEKGIDCERIHAILKAIGASVK